MVGKEHTWQKKLHVATMKMQGLVRTLKAFQTSTK